MDIILEFNNVDLQINSKLDHFISLISQNQPIIAQQLVRNSEKISSLIFFQDFSLNFFNFLSLKFLSINFEYYEIKNRKKTEKIAEILCDFFGWENCNSSILIPHSTKTNFYLNDGFHVGTILKDFHFLDHEQSDFQDIRVYETESMGKVLVLDGCIQMTEDLEDNYTKDMISFLDKDKKYENILLLGAGDLIIPTYLLENYKNIQNVIVCEIDRKVVEIVKKNFSFSDIIEKEDKKGRFKIFFQDGAEFIKNEIKKNVIYDGIIIDCTDVDLDDCISASLFTQVFYENLGRILKTGAFFSQQVSDENSKNKFEILIKGAGYKKYKFIYSETPEYSLSLPIGIVEKE